MSKYLQALLLLGIFLSTCTIQTVVATDFTISSGNSVPYIKTFQNQWNNELEFAVYGWIRVAAWVYNEIQVFRFSANQDINQLKYFRRQSLEVFYPKVQHGYLNQGDNFGQWFFIYQGCNPKTTKTYGWVQNTAGQGQGGYSNNYARHTTSNFYQVIVCLNQGVTGSDRVDVKILWIQAGNGAYRENNFDLRDSNPVVTPPNNPTGPTIPDVKCPTVYSECNFKGQSVSLCDAIPVLNIPQIRSVVIPVGFNKITLHNYKNYQGKTVVFDKTDACIQDSIFSVVFMKRKTAQMMQATKRKVMNKYEEQIKQIEYELAKNPHLLNEQHFQSETLSFQKTEILNLLSSNGNDLCGCVFMPTFFYENESCNIVIKDQIKFSIAGTKFIFLAIQQYSQTNLILLNLDLSLLMQYQINNVNFSPLAYHYDYDLKYKSGDFDNFESTQISMEKKQYIIKTNKFFQEQIQIKSNQFKDEYNYYFKKCDKESLLGYNSNSQDNLILFTVIDNTIYQLNAFNLKIIRKTKFNFDINTVYKGDFAECKEEVDNYYDSSLNILNMCQLNNGEIILFIDNRAFMSKSNNEQVLLIRNFGQIIF
ncbi:hypothetical protein ABPG72_022437 [Tetrahymena utriculariae]